MENNEKDMVTATETAENNVQNDENKTDENNISKSEKMYSRDELNKILATERKSAREEALADAKKLYEQEKSEADKIAKMNDEQKNKYALEKAEERAQTAESRLNAYELKEKAQEIASEKNMNLKLLGVIDFSKETAESVLKKIDLIKETFDEELGKAINDKFKQSTPTQRPSSSKKENPYVTGFLNEF